MKVLTRGLVFVLVFSAVSSVSASFNDVAESDVNFEAIDFLREEGIVSGYPDGSFAPNRVLNRAELTKIVVESLNRDVSNDENCFPDLEEGSWYSRYVCTAKELGLVQGYPDGTFKPSQSINRAEAIKIILEAEGLDIFESESYPDIEGGEWYAGYVGTAYSLNYLPYAGEFNASEKVIRRNFSEIYYRTIKAREDIDREYSKEFVVDEPYYLDVNVGNVELTQKIPKFVLKNEVYFFEGEVTNGRANLNVLNFDGNSSTFLGSSGDKFSVPLWFGSKGIYDVSIGGEVFKITALEDFEDSMTSTEVNFDFYVSTDRNDVVLNQGFTSGVLKKYDFDIGGREIRFINRQEISELIIPNFWLNDLWLDEDEVELSLSMANFSLEDKERSPYFEVESLVLPVVPGFEVITNNIADEDLDFTYGIGDEIDLSFDALIAAEKYLYVIDRSGAVSIMDDNVWISDERVVVSYAPANSTLYEIIEVNDVDGRALINFPVYKRNVLPIGDDPYDTTGLSIEATIENALNIMNEDRAEFGLEPLVLNESLNNLAQFHADDMADNLYVSHTGLDGRKVSERKLDFGIKSFVGENIARNNELLAAQSSLMRSAAHRVNILDPNWTEVGFGIAFDDVGSLYLVQNFSFNSEIVIDDIKDVIEARLGISEDEDLKVISEEWSQVMVDAQEYGTDINGVRLMDDIAALNKFVTGNAVTGISTFVSQIEDLLDESLSDLEGSGYDFYGFDVRLGDDGVLYFVLVVTS